MRVIVIGRISETVIPELMQDAGVQGAPEFSIYEAKAAPDEF